MNEKLRRGLAINHAVDTESIWKFRFDGLFAKAKRFAEKHGGNITLSLPFISFSITPDDIERKVARELMVRLPDKRVLSSKECCDNCIESALASIQEIRSILVEKQVELSHLHDGGLYLIIEYMAEGIRQFLTAIESPNYAVILGPTAGRRPPYTREHYFLALEQLRVHVHRCLFQISKIAGVDTPKVATYLREGEEWERIAHPAPINIGALNHEA